MQGLLKTSLLCESVRENPRRSISRCSQELGLSAILTWWILRRGLGLHPYKIQLTQELKVNDHRQRRVFADWVLEQLEVNPNFAKQIIFSDEAHFWICEQAKLSNLGRYQSTQDTPAPNASRESHCLVRILIWRNHRSVLLPKRSGHCHNRQRRALQIDDKQLLVA